MRVASTVKSAAVAGAIAPAEAARAPRFVTAASLFDGHDASINIMRRLLQASGAEVVHLGHNRSVREIVTAAVQEDADAIAVSSYQGGHVEYFRYMVDMLRAGGGGEVCVFGGGGGVITDAEIAALHDYGVARIYSPEDGHTLGLQGMIDDMLSRVSPRHRHWDGQVHDFHGDGGESGFPSLARCISAIENAAATTAALKRLEAQAKKSTVPVLGITGTGGAGKSSLTDELIVRFRLDYGGGLRIAVFAVDPSRRKSGGALLGDRIRMNAINAPQIYMRSLATRSARGGMPAALDDVVNLAKVSGFDLVIVETPGIGQGDSAIAEKADLSLYVMTPEFGAASQLEKIDMLDFADFVAINKFERKGAADALRDVRKQVQRNRGDFAEPAESMPVFGTMAAHFNDAGVTVLYRALVAALAGRGLPKSPGKLPAPAADDAQKTIIPPARQQYLLEIAGAVDAYHARAEQQAAAARRLLHLRESVKLLRERGAAGGAVAEMEAALADSETALDENSRKMLREWPAVARRYRAGGEGEAESALAGVSLAGLRVPKIALPHYSDDGDLLRWLMRENLPGRFPYTAGVFAFKRGNEDPTRMFAGEGGPARTNKRFKYLSQNSAAKRLSTAFDSVTLYGRDPDERPDIYGKVGNSGVSIATLDDMKVLYGGFDLCDPLTSVSMTINGPAPAILAMFLNTAFAQQEARFEKEHGRAPHEKERAEIHAWTLRNVRGTVQADILKEDQGQNTCIFSTEFSLRMMGDIQQFFTDHEVRNFYSVSISGYHIAEAGANPITQLAFTLANGFTYVESYLARGMRIDDFAPNLSFFFSNGMDPEYTVMGRVARRIWAVALRDKYAAAERSCKLKYHIQTSGRSLHAREMNFNDIRTTLQALIAVYDNCNSLHTNAHNEAFTTPTEDSVRRALAIQMVINREWGLARNENPLQGSFIIDELTDLVEQAVLAEFRRLSERGGVLGAMETGYQRGKIQDESMLYERKKHDGSLPIIGVNTFLNPAAPAEGEGAAMELARSSDEEKDDQISRLRAFTKVHANESDAALRKIQQAAAGGKNVFAELMHAVRCCSLGQITDAMFAVGGEYRRNM